MSANAGEALRPMSKVASGGELARIMLAIKNVLAVRDSVATLIFDEVDAGVSGRAAQKVAQKLLSVSGGKQVLCVTHLPQIAAMADHHFVIEKHSDDESTQTTVKELKEEEMVDELSRLLSGEAITDAVRENALEMKKMAKSKKTEVNP